MFVWSSQGGRDRGRRESRREEGAHQSFHGSVLVPEFGQRTASKRALM
jgi:hypothetical protein